MILYPRVGTHPRKGLIDVRWKYTGRRGFVVAFGPFGRRSLWRAIKWFLFRRDRRRYPLVKQCKVKP